MTPLIIQNFLSILVWCQQSQLIHRLSDFYRFDHHIYLLGSSNNHSIPMHPSLECEGNNVDNGTPQTVLTFGDNLLTGDGNIKERATLKEITSKNTFLAVTVDDLQNRSKLLLQMKAVRNLDRNVKIGVFVTQSVTSLDNIEQLFRLSWNASIVNIFCSFYLGIKDDGASTTIFNIFRYSPFGAFHLINVTGNEQDCFTNKRPNFRQHALRLLELRNVKKFYTEMTIIDSFRSALNASMLFVTVDRVGFTANGENIGDLMHSDKYELPDQVELMYPYRQAKLMVVVPHSKPYSDFFSYLKNGTGTWIRFLVYIVIVIGVSSVLLIISGYLHRKETMPLQRVADVVNLILNDNSAIRYRTLTAADILITTPLAFMGLIMMNGVMSLFKSFVTSPVYQQQMDTLDELYTSPVQILCHYILKANAKLPQLFKDASGYGGWSDKIVGANFIEVGAAFFGLNNSVAHPLFDQQAEALLEMQKRLDKKLFHLIEKPHLARRLFTYRVRPDFPFVEALNDIMHRFHGAGLIDQWVKEDFAGMQSKFWSANPREISFSSQLVLEEFDIPMLVWCGWIASVIVFFCELFWNKIKLYQRQRRCKTWGRVYITMRKARV